MMSVLSIAVGTSRISMSGSAGISVCTSWDELSLDSRIVEAIKRLRWTKPTAVQGACVPLALKGRDMAIHSPTGSGKTGAFLIPILQRIVTEREQMRGGRAERNPVALILLPSVELCEQTVEVANALSKFIRPRLVVDNLTVRGAVTKARVSSAPILVSTVALLGKHCRGGLVTAEELRALRCFVLDEADHTVAVAEHSLRAVQSVLPAPLQTVLVSATLSDGVARVEGELLRAPVRITLRDGESEGPTTEGTTTEGTTTGGVVVESRTLSSRGSGPTGRLRHCYLVATDECHHHTLLYALYRLGHVAGKTLIFTGDDDSMYRVQDFLTRLGVTALVYDAHLPLDVRLDALRRFQTGAVGTFVCTDVAMAAAAEDAALHRGIDFADVRSVVLFDGVAAATPSAFARYTHRVGRCGRSGAGGTAIALFSLKQARAVTGPLRRRLEASGDALEPFKQMQRAEAARLQYRVDNVLAAITRSSTRRQRIAAVASELTRSTYLASHMSQRDDAVLQRILARSRKSSRCDTALLDVPHYMRINGADTQEEYRRRVNPKGGKAAASKRGKRPERTKRDPLSRTASAVRVAKKRRV